MSIVRNPRLIKETINVNRGGKSQVIDEETANFIIKQYFYYGLLSLMNGYIFASQMRFPVKLAYILYSHIPKKFKGMFSYSSRLFGYTFLPVMNNGFAVKYGYNFKPDQGLLKKIAEAMDNDNVFKLIKK